MSTQKSLISVAKDSNVILPKNSDQWQLYRDTSAEGLGNYYAKNKNGFKEKINGLPFQIFFTIKAFAISLNENDIANLADTSFLIMANPGNNEIIPLNIGLSRTSIAPYTMAPNNVLSFFTGEFASAPNPQEKSLLDSRCLEFTDIQNRFATYTNPDCKETTQQNNGFDLYCRVTDITGGVAVNPVGTADSGTLEIYLYYISDPFFNP